MLADDIDNGGHRCKACLMRFKSFRPQRLPWLIDMNCLPMKTKKGGMLPNNEKILSRLVETWCLQHEACGVDFNWSDNGVNTVETRSVNVTIQGDKNPMERRRCFHFLASINEHLSI